MRLIIRLTLAVLLFLNSIPQIDCFVALPLIHYGRNYDDIIASERSIQDEDFDEIHKMLTELFSRLKEDDQQIIVNIVHLTAIIETVLCLRDEETRKNFAGDLYNDAVDMYPMYKDQYHQLLEKLNRADQVILNKTVNRTKMTALQRCQLLNGDE
ncbi:unnamed protein product [Rotaria sordida]|uniref:Uncharacterized protein n=1 Tax=Rotaria sordida TaxID=392033 RepID=A0A815KPF6_9BILA|nr:unnamed protein product [Rotaria sordida]CAF4219576.1 unnamed protein product [Rotaria sordida]